MPEDLQQRVKVSEPDYTAAWSRYVNRIYFLISCVFG